MHGVCYNIHVYFITTYGRFSSTCSDNGNDFFFINWAEENTIYSSVFEKIMNCGTV